MTAKLSSHVATRVRQTPESRATSTNQGGMAFSVNKWQQLRRFLIIGTEGGTYYVRENKLTKDNATAVIACIKENGIKTVNEIVSISDEGRAAKNDYALLALALCVSNGNDDTKRAAMKALPKVARTGTHLFHFVQYANDLRGWGRTLKQGVAKWYTQMDIKKLAFQLVKFRQRDGWSHRDVLRLAHANPKGTENEQARNALFKWTVKGEMVEGLPEMALAFEKAKTANESTVIKLIEAYNLPWEAIPTNMLNSVAVMEALVQKMPIGATIRQLPRLTNVGLLSTARTLELVINRLIDDEQIKKGRVHPVAMLNAYKVYGSGHSEQGSSSWSPNQKVIKALEEGFYKSFKHVEPSGKRILCALDVSASMTWGKCSGSLLNPREASAVMAMVTVRAEPVHHIVGFSDNMTRIPINQTMNLKEVTSAIHRIHMGGTYINLPMEWAMKNRVEVDTFVVYTDNENGSTRLPSRALQEYRQVMGIDARLVVVSMQAGKVTIADPNDHRMLDICGFDTNTPAVISDFAAGRM